MESKSVQVRMNGITGFIFLVLVLAALYFIVKAGFSFFAWLAPVLIIGALLINYRTVLNYLRFMLGLLQRNALAGILAIIISAIGFPLLSGVLLVKAILDRKVKKLKQNIHSRREEEYVEYEEVLPTEKREKHQLPPLEKDPPQSKENQYKDLF